MSTEKLEEFIESGNLQGIDDLLKQNPSLAKGKTSHNVSPLLLACYYKKQQAAQVIFKYLQEISLFEAAAVGKFDAVTYLIATHPELVNTYAEDGFTALGLACFFGHPEVARFLILKGADVNQPSDNGFRVFPLHSAVAGNYYDIAKLLIENGAWVNVQQQAGVTPLHSAAQLGNLEMLILLLENGANVSTRMEGGKLPADLAREKGFLEIAEILS